jgi:coenzyme F420-reducing hydrogenase delta subunit
MKGKLSLSDFLSINGFKVVNKDLGKLQYDINAIRKLKEEYNCNLAEMSRWFNITKQNLSQKLKTKRSLPNYWQGKELNEDELTILYRMIKNNKYYYENELIRIKIYKHNNNSFDFAIFIMHGEEIKCFFDLPKDLKERMIQQNYHKYNELDFEIINEIKNSDMITLNVRGVEELRFRSTDYPVLNSKISSRIKNSSFKSREEYFEYLGYNYVDARTLTDDEIISQLEQYRLDGTKVVHIPCNDLNHYRIANLANKKGFSSLKSFLNYYGFEYKRIRVTDFKENAISKLKKFYLVKENKVYINSLDPMYTSLYVYALNRNKTLNELLNEWGFVRIYKEDLPRDYEPYNGFQNKTYIIKNEEDYQKILDDLIIEDNLIYLNSNEPLYYQLYKLAIRKGTSINLLLEEWGYKRVYINEVIDRSIIVEDKDDVSFVNDMLEKLKEIQGELLLSKVEALRRERSRKLAEQIKKLVCQH